MKRITKKTKEVEVVTVTCDDCGADVTNRHLYYCHICSAELCQPCIVADGDRFRDNTYYCKACWELGTADRIAMDDERDRHNAAIESIASRWRAAGIEARVKKGKP